MTHGASAEPAPPPRGRRWDIALVIAAGGAVGGSLRFLTGQLLPHDPGTIPVSTLVENIVGSFLLGVLMVVVLDVLPPNRYARPFLGVGLLGGFTTFSAFATETRALLALGAVPTAVGYAVATVVGTLLAVAVGLRLTRAVLGTAATSGRTT
jgi:CrcB protein